MDQVQGQMSLTGRDTCFLVVYTSVKIAVVKVEKSETCITNVEKLVRFHSSEILS